MVEVISIKDREARLANRRIRIERDICARAPHESQQMLFGIVGGAYSIKIDDMNAELYNRPKCFEREIDGFKIWTTTDRINQLCGEEAQYHTEKWLESQVAAELEEVKEYLEDHNYGIIVEKWDAGEREWKEEQTSVWGFTGVKWVKQEVESMLNNIGPAVVCTECLELIS